MNDFSSNVTVPRLVFAVTISIHALIHMIGVAREWNLADVSQFAGKTLFPIAGRASKISGFLWLLAFLFFIAAATGLFLKPDLWWIAALAGVAISQLLIIVYWNDAKAGTILNVVILIVSLAGYGRWSFANASREEVRNLIENSKEGNPAIVTQDNLKHLPEPIQRWLIASGVVGKLRAQTVRLKQRGFMRTDPEGSWMPAEAEQFFTIDEPGFIWTVDVTMAGVIPISGRDRYRNGKGNMLIKAFSLVPIVNGSGEKIDQGTLLRYLGEIVWFPSAALSPFIEWTPIDSTAAQATMQYRNVSASAIFQTDGNGNIVSCSAERYMGDGDSATLERWFVSVNEWKVMEGLRIPIKGDVAWKLASGDFTYYQWEILQIEYNTKDVLHGAW